MADSRASTQACTDSRRDHQDHRYYIAAGLYFMMFGAEFGVIAFLSEHDHNLISEGGPSLDLQVRQFSIYGSIHTVTQSSRYIIELAAKPGTLEPEAKVRILALVLACGVLSIVVLIAGAVHVMCYEQRKPKIRAVLYKRITYENSDYSSV